MDARFHDPSTPVIRPGEVLLDTTTLTQAEAALHGAAQGIEYEQSLAQLVEAIVLREGIRVDARTFNHSLHGEVVDLRHSLSGLVDVLRLPRTLDEALALLVRQSIREADLPNIYASADQIEPGLAERIRSEGSQLYSKSNLSPLPHLNDSALVVAVRSMYYYSLSSVYGLPYVPNTMRVPLLTHILQGQGRSSQRVLRYANMVLDGLGDKLEGEIDDLRDLTGDLDLSLEVPLVFNDVLLRSKTRAEIIPRALELRDSAEARAFRQVARGFDQAVRTGQRAEIIERSRELKEHLVKLGQSSGGLPVEVDLAFPWSIAVNLGSVVRLFKDRSRRHLLFLSRLYESAQRSNATWRSFHALPLR
ncbi:MAG TPA: hypothetical protein VFS21_17045 [Roseiflexaceae bacterium]|nr:hypothetical protein [Roseiflexaceae bacterium]